MAKTTQITPKIDKADIISDEAKEGSLNLEQIESEGSKDLSNPDGQRTRVANPNPSHRMNILNAIVKESRTKVLPEKVWPHLLHAWMVILEGTDTAAVEVTVTGGVGDRDLVEKLS